MNRSIRLVALVAVATALTACSQAASSIGEVPSASPTAIPSQAPSESAPPSTALPSASPTPTTIPTPSPTEPAIDRGRVLAADGIGPYVVGSRLAALESHGLVANVEPRFHCDDEWQHVEATGRYAGRLKLSFHLGRLTDVHTASDEYVTPSGAGIGMPLTELERLYGNRGTLIAPVSGNQALSVHVPDTALGIVFFLDATNTTVWSMSAGQVERLDIAAVVGEGC